jgi:LEA14-like dessication related protein
MVALLPLGSCATLRQILAGQVKAPTVRITGMDVDDLSLERVKSTFKIQITNPNPVALSLQGLNHALSLEGKTVAKGNATKGIQLAANGSSTTDLQVTIPLVEAASTLLALLQKKEVDLKLVSNLTFRTPIGPLTVPTTYKTKMPVPQIPKVTVKNFAITSASLSGIGVEILTHVQNPNGFKLPVDGLAFDVKLNGHQVLTHKPVAGFPVPAQGSRDVKLPFTVSLVDVGLSAAKLATNPTLSWQVNADLNAGVLQLPFNASGAVPLIP